MNLVREATIEWGCWTEYSNTATCTEYVDLDVAEENNGKKLIITPSVNDGSDGQYCLDIYVVFEKDGKVVYVAEDSEFYLTGENQIEITYPGLGPYDNYKVFYTAYSR